jgi:peptidoglycan/LPS O-acetylase OafA/YrhL
VHQARAGGFLAKHEGVDSGNRRPPLPVLTTLRFFAAAEVLVYHAPGLDGISSHFIRDLFSAGYQAVTFFFVLSGFILTYAYTGRTERDYLNATTRSFWRSRIARIAPTYFFALLVGLPAFLYGALVAKIVSVEHLILGLALIPAFMQAWWPPVAFLWNGPAWSLSVEFFFYAIFPALACLTSRLPRGLFLVLAFALVVATAVARATMQTSLEFATDPVARSNFELYFPIFHLPQFIFGIALGRVYLFGPIISARLHVGMLYVGAGLLIALFGFRSNLPEWVSWLRTDAGLALLFGLVIFGGARTEGRNLKMLACPALVLLGEASYAMYILHTPIYFWWHWITAKAMGWNLPLLVDLFFSVALVTGASILIYLHVEKPLRRWLTDDRRRLGGTLRIDSGTRIRT